VRTSASILALLFLTVAAPAAAQGYRDLTNLDFEQGAVDSFPPGWTARGALRLGYRVTISDREPHGGRASALIRRDSVVWAPEYGSMAKKLDARPYRGRRVKVTGWLRFEALPGLGGLGGTALYMRVDREGGREGFGGNTQERLVRSGPWAKRELWGEVAADADTLVFGAYLDRSGRAWVDDVTLTALGPIGEGDQPPRPLTERGVQNLVAFAKLLGYVRHFHPSDESAAANWDSVAIAGVDEVEGAGTPAELAAALERVFLPIAPTVRVATRPLVPLDPATAGGPRRSTSPTTAGGRSSPGEPARIPWPRSAPTRAARSGAASGARYRSPSTSTARARCRGAGAERHRPAGRSSGSRPATTGPRDSRG
jgi:hypothetical protein